MLSEDESDLTSMSEDDEYGSTSTKKRSSGKRKSKRGGDGGDGGFRVKNALKVPRPTTYTVQALYDQIHGCDINLEPDYQRDVVWPEAKQIGIIDSIFRNFYIPPVIFAVSTFDDGSETRTCIDGKQRLTSIYRFMDGLIPHKDPTTSEKLWYKDVGQAKRPKRLLPEKYRRLFANKQIVCVEYHDITNADEREIFQRVQLGMALTPAEKLQVINSPRAQFIRELQTHYVKEEGSGLNTSALDWDRSRGADFRCLAQAIYVIDKYSAAFKTTPSIVQLEKWLSDEGQVLPTVKKKILDTFDILVLLVHDKTLKSVFKQPTKVSPVEFVLIVVLIAVWKDKMSVVELSEAIGAMRHDVRTVHADIRMNTRVTKTMLEYVRNLKPGKVPAEQTAGAVVAKGVSLPTASSRSGDKRKRVDKMDVDDGTYDSNSSASDDDGGGREKQMMKKAKRSPPSTTTTLAKVGPPKGAMNPPSAPTSRPPSSAAGQPHQSQQQQQPPPQPSPLPPPPSAPRLDRMAGVRAARAAMTNMNVASGTGSPRFGPPPLIGSAAGGAGATNGANSLPSPRTPSALPSPGVPFFNGGMGGIPFSSPQQTFLPTSQPSTLATPMALPVHPNHQPQNSGTGLGINYNGLPNPGSGGGGVGRESEMERMNKERWEMERYGRVQRESLDQGAPTTSASVSGQSGSGRGRGWTAGVPFMSDSGWGNRGK